jgi:hypothetical protein
MRRKQMPDFPYKLDRWVAVAKAVALVVPFVFALASGNLAKPEEPSVLAGMIIIATLSILLEILVIVGVWHHKKWAFGLTAGIYVFVILSGIFVTIVSQVSGVFPTRPVKIADWHDVYVFPIAAYCAFRYIMFNQFEMSIQENKD